MKLHNLARRNDLQIRRLPTNSNKAGLCKLAGPDPARAVPHVSAAIKWYLSGTIYVIVNFRLKVMNADDGSPLYKQLARDIERDIRGGRYGVDQALPSERVLAESLRVSRITARKAIGVLVARGLVLSRQGSGNYIAPYLEQPLVRLCSFTEELERRGYKPDSKWLLRKVGPASVEERHNMGLESGARVARLHRVRLADGVRMALEYSVLPATLLPRPQALNGSLYAYLSKVGCAPVRAKQHLRAVGATPEMALHLEISQGSPLLWAHRVAMDASGRVVEITQSYCRSDYYDFVAEMRA